MEKNKDFKLTVPVAYVIFNRPDCTKKSFESIRTARPKELFIIADGPRSDHVDDAELCAECRKIVEHVDWDCNVYRNYSEKNLGCGIRPSTGFSWVFSKVDRAIIIEDDCVPSMSFYRFCQELLEKYKDDDRVYSVAGANFGLSSENGADYYFSHYTNSWGWATWKRVWDRYDFNVKSFSETDFDAIFQSMMLEPAFVNFWKRQFRRAYERVDMSAWDYQFTFLSLKNRALHIYPQKNLISYQGFDDNATHTNNVTEDRRVFWSTKEAYDISFPLKHPLAVQDDFRMDYLRMTETFNVSTVYQRICKELPEGVIEEVKKYPKIIIYGAGEVCRDVISLLARERIDEFSIAVTKVDSKQYVMGNEVHEIADYVDVRNQAIVIIAVTKNYEEEIADNLEHMGFNKYIKLHVQSEKQKYDEKYKNAPLDRNKIALITTNDGAGHGKNIVNALLNRKPNIDIVWFVHDIKKQVPAGVRKVLYSDYYAYIRELMTAYIWLADTGVPVYMKKPEQINIQMKHWASITLKMFGYDEMKYRGEEDIRKFGIQGLDRMDYVLVGSDFDERTCRSGFRFDGDVVRVGSPRSDVLFYNSDSFDKVRDIYDISSDEKCVLFAPTYRLEGRGNTECIYSNDLDFEQVIISLRQRFDGKWRILLRLHPFVADQSNIIDYPEYVTDVSDYYDSEELVAISDAMITDYSSIMFEPAFVGKPVFLLATDKEKYLSKERGFLIEYDSLPFPIAETNEQLAEIILSFNQEKYEADVTAFLDKYGVHEDGHASERAAEFILGLMCNRDSREFKGIPQES